MGRGISLLQDTKRLRKLENKVTESNDTIANILTPTEYDEDSETLKFTKAADISNETLSLE
jgi:hypothetical protein